MKLLSTQNTKLLKGAKLGYMTFGLSLAPHKLSGKNLCPHASKGCIAACLNTAGMGIYKNVQAARLAKAQLFNDNSVAFYAQLHKEIAAAIKKADKAGMKLAIRLNVVSDVNWNVIIKAFPTVQFYDYTPNVTRMIAFLQGKLPPNYHLTFSRKENNQAQVDLIMSMGGNVAIVFANMPKEYNGKPVVDGDESDVRFLDNKGVVVGLKAKGKAKKDQSGFVVLN